MATKSVAHWDPDMNRTKSSEDDSEESLELDNTVLNLSTLIDARSKMLDSSLAKSKHHDVMLTKIKDISCTLSPIRTDEEEVAMVTPMNQNWKGQTQSTPKESGAVVSSRRGLVYQTNKEKSLQADNSPPKDDQFVTLSEVYDDDMSYDQLLAEVSRISNVSVPNRSQKGTTTASKIDLRDILPAQNNLDLSSGPLNTSGDIHDEKYFASKCNPELSTGRFTGIQSSRHAFDETTEVQELMPSADILGLEQYLSSDSDDEDNDDADKTKTNFRDTHLKDNKDHSLTKTFHSVSKDIITKSKDNNVADKSTAGDINLQETKDDDCYEKEICSLNQNAKLDVIPKYIKEPGELSSTTATETTDTEPETDISAAKRAPAKTSTRKRKLHRDRGSEKEEGELTTTTDDTDTDSRTSDTNRKTEVTDLHKDTQAKELHKDTKTAHKATDTITSVKANTTDLHRDAKATDLHRDAQPTHEATDTRISNLDKDISSITNIATSSTDTGTSDTDTETTVTTDTDDSEQYTWVEKTIEITWAEKTLLADPRNKTKSFVGSCETLCSRGEVYGPVALPQAATKGTCHESQKHIPYEDDTVIVIDDSECSTDTNEVVNSLPGSLSTSSRKSREPKTEKNWSTTHQSNFKSNKSLSLHCGSFVLLSEDLVNSSSRTSEGVKAIPPKVKHQTHLKTDFTEDSFDLIESGAFAESFIVIDSPEEDADGSFMVIDEVTGDEFLAEEELKTDDFQTNRPLATKLTVVGEKVGKACKEESNLDILKQGSGKHTGIKNDSFKKQKQKGDCFSQVKKASKMNISPIKAPFTENIVKKSTPSSSKKKKIPMKTTKTENIFKKAISQIEGKENIPVRPTQVTLEKKVMDIGFETELMRLVKQKWKVTGIQRQDENLTFSSCARQKRNDLDNLYLEGSDRTPPLFKDNSKLTRNCESLGCESPKMKKRKTDQSPYPTTNYFLLNLQAELATIEAEHIKSANMLQIQHQQRIKMLQKHHNMCLQNLRTRHNLERKQFYRTFHGHVALPYLEQRMILFKHSHQNQVMELQTVAGIEMTNLLAVLEGEKQAQNTRFEMLKEPKRQMIQNITVQSQDAQVAMTTNPHETVQLWKAPCKSNKEEKSLVEVCLPSDIASYMMREDELYDAHYVY